MNPLIWLGGGGLVAYLLLRHRDAVAAALSAPVAPAAPVVPAAPLPVPVPLPPARPPQITT
ncbi:MAG TPA: hypothetical protein VFT22_15265, partial [Kofleriaceae bacterium]|nr:hypothetical protein [Kofleriaceae bacterium]